MNCVIDYMIAHNIPRTVENYVRFAYLGDKTVDDVEGEDLVEIQDLIEEGALVN
jgi:hypothetical protein